MMLVGLQAGEALEVGIQHRPMERNVGIPALALHLDQPRLAKFLHMMRYGGWADQLVLMQPAAGHAFRRRHLLQDREAVRIGQCARDGLELLLGQNNAG
jgi:hypothetical protein